MSDKKNILIVVGTRPNFIKVTQFKKLANTYPPFNIKIVHTSQHYSDEMSTLFFQEFDLQPDFFLDIPSNLSPVSQMAEIMKNLEKLIQTKFFPHLIIVVGDVNSTLAGALVANKMNIPLAHIESGLRSFDQSMPEEYNRILTDRMAQYFFVTEKDAILNLKQEGIKDEQIFYVGNTMIDTLIAYQDKIESSNILNELKLTPHQYILLTFHRPNNVDDKNGLHQIIHLIESLNTQLSQQIKNIVFPIHPRTENNFKKFNLWEKLNAIPSLMLTPPQSYFHFQKLIKYAFAVITDSGGVQEETTYLKIPCITIRPSTERPVTLWEGTNILLPFDISKICDYLNTPSHYHTNYQPPELWDGKSTERILKTLNTIMQHHNP
ncbi:MAG: UDP-N-acetylglucosamine 2-epimerase (non-hydrolyzing) [Bacteroidia bacterium]|nr:UDP-N-acetylglucosamine 2-epimerase (non-hydrolyzing) [Bacteroidia bacterium]